MILRRGLGQLVPVGIGGFVDAAGLPERSIVGAEAADVVLVCLASEEESEFQSELKVMNRSFGFVGRQIVVRPDARFQVFGSCHVAEINDLIITRQMTVKQSVICIQGKTDLGFCISDLLQIPIEAKFAADKYVIIESVLFLIG